MRLFLFNYNKEGPGVNRNALPKEGLALFLEIFIREFTSLIKLNLFFIVSCIPIITIGPALGAMTAVTIKMVKDEPSDLYYDFKVAFKKNWKSSFLIGLFALILMIILGRILIFFIMSEGFVYNVASSIVIILGIISGFLLIYVYPMSVSVELPLRIVIKNSFLLSILYIKYSILTFILCLGLFEVSIMLFPFTIPIVLFCTFSFMSFFSSFCAWHGIKKYIVK